MAGESVIVEGETLGPDDVLLHRQPLPGRVVESAAGITVVLETQVDDELRAEGLARELVTRVQNLRKQAELDVAARIRLGFSVGSGLAGVFERAALRELIAQETLAVELTAPDAEIGGYAHRLDDEIDGCAVTIALGHAT